MDYPFPQKVFPSPAGPPMADISNIAVDSSLNRDERIAKYHTELKNPFCFYCQGIVIHARYQRDGDLLEDCLKRILL